jgi:TolB protein
MNKKILLPILFLLFGAASSFAAPQMIAFERNQAVWIAKLDGIGEKKVADGIFPAISPDGTRVAFNTVEKTSDTSYVRQERALSKRERSESMKQFIVAIFLCVAFSGVVNAGQRKIAYERGEQIFVADADGSHSKKIAEGALPEISPDGTRVAFNTEGDAKNRPGPERHIAIADVANGKVTVLPNIPSDNCFGPVWSPDGKQLAFSIMADKAWQLGLVNADGSGFRFVKNAELRPEAFGAPEWARDGKSIFCHDLDNIYQIDLDGNVLKKWELAKILTDASMNGGDRLSVSPDGKALLMDVDCGSEHERKNWDGPQPAIEEFDLSADKAVRATAKDDFVWEPFWLSANEFLCIIQKENENQPSIYRMSLDGKNPKLLVKHARTPSASAP